MKGIVLARNGGKIKGGWVEGERGKGKGGSDEFMTTDGLA